jgi:hypothetical protein
MTIVLQFSTIANPYSWAIEWFSGQPHSFAHVDAVLPDGRLLGARHDRRAGVPSGVQIRPENYATFKRKLVVSIPCAAGISNDFYFWLKTQIGKPYDTACILAFLAYADWHKIDGWDCSALIAAALCRRFLPFPPAFPPSKIVPDALLLALSFLVDVWPPDSGQNQSSVAPAPSRD